MNSVEITWQEIETAPRDPVDGGKLGPSILLACYGGKEPLVCEGHWRPALPAGENGRAYEEGWVSSIDPDVYPRPYLHVLFWAPRPAAPIEPRYFREGQKSHVDGPINDTQAL